MILFPTTEESASLPYSFPHKLFDALFTQKWIYRIRVYPDTSSKRDGTHNERHSLYAID